MLPSGRVRLSEDDGPTMLTLVGALDVAAAPELRECLLELYEDGTRDIVIDLIGVDLIDSSGLGVLVAAVKRYREADGNVRLRSPSVHVRRLLDTTGLSRVFDIEP